eukprot:SAG11_NODE_12380_length_706_cov_1.105437_1_plen_74_part_01
MASSAQCRDVVGAAAVVPGAVMEPSALEGVQQAPIKRRRTTSGLAPGSYNTAEQVEKQQTLTQYFSPKKKQQVR